MLEEFWKQIWLIIYVSTDEIYIWLFNKLAMEPRSQLIF